jgi:hypothetical protein
MSKDNELAWALHSAAKMLGDKYKITCRTVTTDLAEHDEVVIEYGHRIKPECPN